jgi:hypothetical protein
MEVKVKKRTAKIYYLTPHIKEKLKKEYKRLKRILKSMNE